MDIDAQLESILFLSPNAMRTMELATLIGVSEDDVTSALTRLDVVYNAGRRGIRLAQHEGRYRMTTSPESADAVAAFVEDEVHGALTKPQLETVTVIAYRGPITKGDLEHIRGVHCGIILRNLLVRGLIESKEDPTLLQTVYSVSMDFLHTLGVEHIDQLPDYATLHTADVIDRVLEQRRDEERAVNDTSSAST